MKPKDSPPRSRWLLPLCSALAVLVAAVLSTSALAGDLRAYFDRKSVYEGDTVTLIIESTAGSLGRPDLSGLGADFDLLGTSQSTNISIVNGRRTDTVRLLVTLAPKRIGTIDVSPIDVGGERTESLSLQVNEIPEGGSGSAGDDIFVELEVGTETGEPMVQQQVPLTVRLFTALPLIKGTLDEPRAEGALVTKLGEDRQFSTRRDGREYRVVERRYSLSPERSGELRIPPLAFEGSVRTGKARRGGFGGRPFDAPFFDRFFDGGMLSRDPFGMFEGGEPVSARSRAVTLEVKARPGGYGGDHWLPAEALEIVDSWTESPPELRVGEPVTRTLTLRAKGLSGPQIPEIEIPEAPGLRVYPEKAENETRSDGETIYGISRQGATLIASQAGELVIPEIRLTWWDTVAQQERVTTVPGWTLNVGAGSMAGTIPNHPATPEQGRAPDVQEEPAEPIPEAAEGGPGIDRRLFAGGAVLSVLLLAVVWALRLYRRRRQAAGSIAHTPVSDRRSARKNGAEARKALHAACEANDAPGAAKALLDWAEVTWPGDAPRNLGTLGARLARGADQVRELERRLYAPESGSWEGAAMWRALQGGLSDVHAAEQMQSDLLDPLYPPRI
jgi:hypothetical protein